MGQRYVLDTSGLIAYFENVFPQPKRLSDKVRTLIAEALNSQTTPIRISVPSVVFIEVFDGWLDSEEVLRKFYYEVFRPMLESPNVEIRAIEQEVLESLLKIGAPLDNHDIHDKIILASAISLQCPLITSDSAIAAYISEHGLPRVMW
jgi:PIN domain nuclease of toxin-antitoxin system